MYQHSVNSNLVLVTLDDFTILNSGYKHNKVKKKISEALDLTLTSKIHQFPWNFLIETLSLLNLSLFFYINFPKSNNICSWVLLCYKYCWVWVRILQIFYIDSQSDLICTESILFRLYGLYPSIFSIYFISFLVPAQNQLFSLPLFFFAHLILSMLGLFYLFFHILQFRRCIRSPVECLGWDFCIK